MLTLWSVAAGFAGATLLGLFKQVWPYLATGWLAVAALALGGPHLHSQTLLFIIAGAVAYTFGIRFFLGHGSSSFPHLKWHLFVLLGSGLHTAAAFV